MTRSSRGIRRHRAAVESLDREMGAHDPGHRHYRRVKRIASAQEPEIASVQFRSRRLIFAAHLPSFWVVPAEEPGPIRCVLSIGHGVWVPAFAGTTSWGHQRSRILQSCPSFQSAPAVP